MLIVLTHAFIDDVSKSVAWIVKSADLPVSVVIIGLGRISEMAQLQAFESRQTRLVDSNGAQASRSNSSVHCLESYPDLETMQRDIITTVNSQMHSYFGSSSQ